MNLTSENRKTKTQDNLLVAALLIVVFTNLALQYIDFGYRELSTALMIAVLVGINRFNLKSGKLDNVSPIWKRTAIVSSYVLSVFGVLFFAYGIYKLAQ